MAFVDVDMNGFPKQPYVFFTNEDMGFKKNMKWSKKQKALVSVFVLGVLLVIFYGLSRSYVDANVYSATSPVEKDPFILKGVTQMPARSKRHVPAFNSTDGKEAFKGPYTCFARTRQMILIGYAYYITVDAVTLEDCLGYCKKPEMESEYECKSVMYFHTDQECILNSESHHSKPELFVPEEDEKVDYFDVTRNLKRKTCTGVKDDSEGEGCMNGESNQRYISFANEMDDRRANKWTKKQKTFACGVLIGVILLIIIVVVVIMCTKSDPKDVSTTTTTSTSTTTTVPSTTTSAQPLHNGCAWTGPGYYPIFILEHNGTIGPPISSEYPVKFDECWEDCYGSHKCDVMLYENKNCSIFYIGHDTPTRGATVISKHCVKSEKINNATSTIHFEAFAQKALVGCSIQFYLGCQSMELCLGYCLDAPQKECMSLMYYPEKKECYISGESRRTKPNAFIDEQKETVVYMDKLSDEDLQTKDFQTIGYDEK